MALNALDGMMARTYNQQTKKGEILNELGDIISDLFIFFLFSFLNKQTYIWLSYLFVLALSMNLQDYLEK